MDERDVEMLRDVGVFDFCRNIGPIFVEATRSLKTVLCVKKLNVTIITHTHTHSLTRSLTLCWTHLIVQQLKSQQLMLAVIAAECVDILFFLLFGAVDVFDTIFFVDVLCERE